jgi:hypothetical protein
MWHQFLALMENVSFGTIADHHIEMNAINVAICLRLGKRPFVQRNCTPRISSGEFDARGNLGPVARSQLERPVLRNADSLHLGIVLAVSLILQRVFEDHRSASMRRETVAKHPEQHRNISRI